MSVRVALLLALSLCVLAGAEDDRASAASALAPTTADPDGAEAVTLNATSLLTALNILENPAATDAAGFAPGASRQVVFLPNGSVAVQVDPVSDGSDSEGEPAQDLDSVPTTPARTGLPSGRQAVPTTPTSSGGSSGTQLAPSATVSRSSDGQQIIITLNPAPSPSAIDYTTDVESSAADSTVPVLGGVASLGQAVLGEADVLFNQSAVPSPRASPKLSQDADDDPVSTAVPAIEHEGPVGEPPVAEHRAQPSNKKKVLTAAFAGSLGGLVGLILIVILPMMIILVRRQRRMRDASVASEGSGDLESGPAQSRRRKKDDEEGATPILGLLPRLVPKRRRAPSRSDRPYSDGRQEEAFSDGGSSRGEIASGFSPGTPSEQALDGNADASSPPDPARLLSSGGSSGGVWDRPPPWTDGRISPEEIGILSRPDGSPWLLGTGAYGVVYKALRDGVQPVAVKVLGGMEAGRRRDEFIREVTLLRSCRDRNIVQFIGACIRDSEAMLVTEFMDLGDLWRAATLRNTRGERIFGWHGRGRKVLLDVARGLHFLHSRSIVHLDLKSANILLARDGTAKVADVGFARVVSKSYLPSSVSGLGTFAWRCVCGGVGEMGGGMTKVASFPFPCQPF